MFIKKQNIFFLILALYFLGVYTINANLNFSLYRMIFIAILFWI